MSKRSYTRDKTHIRIHKLVELLNCNTGSDCHQYNDAWPLIELSRSETWGIRTPSKDGNVQCNPTRFSRKSIREIRLWSSLFMGFDSSQGLRATQ